MNNQRKAVYNERLRVLKGNDLKKQVIGYGERTMEEIVEAYICLLYTSPSPRDLSTSRMPSSA